MPDLVGVHREQADGVGATGSHQVVLVLVVGEHQSGDLVGHRLQQLLALLGFDLAGGDQRVDQDLDVDLVVRTVNPGRVVQGVGVDPPARQIEFDPAARGHSEVAAFADNLGAHLVSVDPHRIVGAIADVGVGLGFGLDVGADAAVEQQVHRCLQNRPDQVGRGHLGGPRFVWALDA